MPPTTRLLASASAAAMALLAGCAQNPSADPADNTDPTALVNQLEATTGKFAGQRRSGAKGICATGEAVGVCPGDVVTAPHSAIYVKGSTDEGGEENTH